MNKTHFPDPDWSETDAAGHVHAFIEGDLPTLKIVVSGHQWCDECGESREHNVYACRQCGKKVEPHFLHEYVQAEATVMLNSEGHYPTAPVAVAPPVFAPSPLGEITELAIEARHDNATSVYTSSGAVEYLPGTPRYILIVNSHRGGMPQQEEIPLTEIEVQVAAQAAKRGRGAMLEFAQSIIRDRMGGT